MQCVHYTKINIDRNTKKTSAIDGLLGHLEQTIFTITHPFRAPTVGTLPFNHTTMSPKDSFELPPVIYFELVGGKNL